MKPNDISVVTSLAKSKTLPILNNVKITTSGIESTDSDIYVKYLKVIDTKEDLLVPASELKTRGLEGALQAIESIKQTSEDDFPKFDFQIWNEPQQLGLDTFKHMVNAHIHATKDESRPILTCVWLVGDGKHIEVSATDSYRLYSMKLKSTLKCNLNVPRSVIELLKRTKETNWTVQWTKDNGQMRFASGNWIITAVLRDGTPPEWHKLIPTEAKTKVVLSVDQLKAIKKLKPLAGSIEIYRDSIQYTNAQQNKETVKNVAKTEQANGNVELGAIKVIMPLKDSNEDAIIALNVDYLIDLADTKTVTLYVPENKLSPVIVEG